MPKVGRRTKWYESKTHGTILGLVRRTDGRWEVKATGQTFREADENLAIMRFRKLSEASQSVQLPGKLSRTANPWSGIARAASRLGNVDTVDVDSPELWAWVKAQLIARPFYVAERTGIPQLASFADLPIPGPSPSLSDLVERYCNNSGVEEVTQSKARKVIADFRKMTGIETLRDITTEKLISYREAVKQKTTNPHTLSNKFGKLKTVIGFGLKDGLDSAAISGALAKMKVLYVQGSTSETDPNPIDPAIFRKLLAGADAEMRAVLLLSLNACLYLSEALAIEWSEINFSTGSFQTNRNKTGIPRAAVLWPITLEAIQAIPHKAKSPFVFTSSHGKSFNVNGYRDKFARFRKAVSVGEDILFNNIRDGAYTAACEQGVDFQLCQMLSGHKLPGQSDAYVKRTPQKVRPACEAVYAAYSPFPESASTIRIGRPRKAA